ncbi:MAG: type II toxin-antitoxin system VapC family toxin [Pyrinomonadaceae bacterium]
MILIDSNILLDLLDEDSEWYEWSAEAVVRATDGSTVAINPIIFAETSIRFASPEEFEEVFPANIFKREPLPFSAAFLAGKAHLAYRQKGGSRGATLPDFFIGAHAAVSGHRILTRDPRRFKRYFPTVELIAP